MTTGTVTDGGRFVGNIENSGKLSGTWNNQKYGQNGSFTGQRAEGPIQQNGTYQMGGATQGKALAFTDKDSVNVSTLAGAANVSGSTNGTGAAARFYTPVGMTTDGANLYVADVGNHTIRKVVIATGAVTTLAGQAGSLGAVDGTGAAARFNYPVSITTDGSNLYVGDEGNDSIRKVVIATGVVTTVAGSISGHGSNDGVGTAASFYHPDGITTDGTNLFVSDTNNHTIRKIVIATRVVSTLAGTAGSYGATDGTGATARFFNPLGITTDGTNLYVADWGNKTIRKVVISTGVVTTVAGSAASAAGSTDGTGAAARFDRPWGVTCDGANLYVAEYGNSTIRKVVIATSAVTTIAGMADATGSADGSGTVARFYYPSEITTDGTNLYVTDGGNQTIRKLSPNSSTPTAPTVSAFAIPATSSSLTVAITQFTASDTVGVSGYLVSESAAAPSASAPGWTASAPSSYTFASEGSKTLYAWAKNAAGLVSTSRSASVTITVATTINPNYIGTFKASIYPSTVTITIASNGIVTDKQSNPDLGTLTTYPGYLEGNDIYECPYTATSCSSINSDKIWTITGSTPTKLTLYSTMTNKSYSFTRQ